MTSPGTGGRWGRVRLSAGSGEFLDFDGERADRYQRRCLYHLSLQDNRWYCIETHEQMNTPGVANGISEAWVDGVKVAHEDRCDLAAGWEQQDMERV